MFSGQPTTKTGMIAGGIAMIAALVAMRFLSEMLGPRPILTEMMPQVLFQNLWGTSGGFTRFLMSGHSQVRMVVFLIIIFMIIGCALGIWMASADSTNHTRPMQAAAILFFATITLMYVGSTSFIEYFLQEIGITLAVAFLIYAVVANWLLKPGESQPRTSIAMAIGGVGAFILAVDIWML